jgi:hypothetical protein
VSFSPAAAFDLDSPLPRLAAEIGERVGRITFASDVPPAPLTERYEAGHVLALWRHCSSGNGDGRFVTCCNFVKNGVQTTHYREKRFPLHSRERAAYRSACGLAKPENATAIAHYTQNADGETVFGAADFDAHNGGEEWARAERYAVAALVESLKLAEEFKLPAGLLFRVLEHTGGGFRLSLITRELVPRDTMARMLRFIASRIGCEIASGIAEFSPNPFSDGGEYGTAVKLPGSFNPKRGMPSVVLFDDLQPLVDELLARLQQSKKRAGRLPEIKEHYGSLPLLRHKGGEEEALAKAGESLEKIKRGLLDRHAIRRTGERNAKMKSLVGAAYEMMSAAQAVELAGRQYEEGRAMCGESADAHRKNALNMINTCRRGWLKKLSLEDRAAFDALATDAERDCFRILRGWHKHADGDWARMSAAQLAVRIGVTRQGVDKMRQRFEEAGIIETKRDGQSWFFRWKRQGEPSAGGSGQPAASAYSR